MSDLNHLNHCRPAHSYAERVLKVNHAGENGAVHIYAGQLLVAAAIKSIVEEEQKHHDTSAAHARPGGVWTAVLSRVVAASTQAVIWLGMRF